MAGAAFFDLDRTLLRRASGPALSAAMRETGTVTRKVPFESLLFGWFDHFGESLPSILLARQAALIARGRPWDAFDEAAELAGKALADLVEPFGHLLIEEHQAAGRPAVLATTTPEHLVRPLAERLGLDDVIATRYEIDASGRFTGALDGHFVWSLGKLAAVREWAEDHDVDLADSFAYSDSIYDSPMLQAVGNPGAVNPDPRLLALATLSRWPVIHFDAAPGVVKIPLLNLEVQRAAMLLGRPETYPYVRWRVEGAEHVPAQGGAILVGNHRSYFDVAAMLTAMSRVGRMARFLGKKELFDVPVLGSALRAMGGISVDRQHEDPDSPDPLAQAAYAVRGGEVVGLMPQGTIPRGIRFFDPDLEGKPGAARLAKLTRAPVIPFAITGTEVVWPRSAKGPNITTVLNPPTVTIRFGPPVDLKYRSERKDTERILGAVSALLPDDVRHPPRPTLEELARTYPDGRVPEEDRWFAVDGED